MSAAHVNAKEISDLYMQVYCYYAACAILVYDWFLCLSQEVRFIWNWHSKVTSSSLVYSFSRYAVLIEALLIVATNYPMSDLSCRANIWAQAALKILGTIAFSVFSALRAYALSNRNKWLSAIIILLALPPTATTILQCFYEAPENLPSPLNCSAPSSLSPTLTLSVGVVWRGSQLAAELLVVGITWWYGYQSYRIRKGIKLGKTISSLLIYNGSLYFLCLASCDPSMVPGAHRKICRFLATLYILDIVFNTISLPDTISNATNLLSDFYDPITSILVCRFMLELRQFDSSPASVTYPEMGSRVRGHTASRDILQFAAQPSDSLPTSIVSFAGLVHVDSALSETDPDAIDDDAAEWREMDVVAPTRTMPPSHWQSPAREQPSEFKLEHSV